MSDSITEDFDSNGDGTADGSVTWEDGGGDPNYYEQGEVTMDVNGDGVDETYTMEDSDENGYIDHLSGDLDGNGTTDEWNDNDGDGAVDSDEITLT